MSVDLRLRTVTVPGYPEQNQSPLDYSAAPGAFLTTKADKIGEWVAECEAPGRFITLQVKIIFQPLAKGNCTIQLMDRGRAVGAENAYGSSLSWSGIGIKNSGKFCSRVGLQVLGHAKLRQRSRDVFLSKDDLVQQPGELLFAKTFSHSLGRQFVLHRQVLAQGEEMVRLMPGGIGGVNTTVVFPYGGVIDADLNLSHIAQAYGFISTKNLSATTLNLLSLAQMRDLRDQAPVVIADASPHQLPTSLAEDIQTGQCHFGLKTDQGVQRFVSFGWRVVDQGNALLELDFHNND
ncbi:MAG: hypothetical protein ACK5O7_02700 [Holosporales bacterium]